MVGALGNTLRMGCEAGMDIGKWVLSCVGETDGYSDGNSDGSELFPLDDVGFIVDVNWD